MARIYTSLTDGGAVRLLSPSSYNQEWTLDAYNGDFRIYNRDADTQSGYIAPITINADSGEVSVSTDLTAGGQTLMRYRGQWGGDFNSTALECGVYWVHITDSTPNAPAVSANYGWLICYGPQSVQQFVEYDYHRVYTRGYTNSQWYPWACTGGTDSVVASGTSGGWNYIKYANGNAICARTVDFTGAYIGAAVGNLYRSGGDVIVGASYPFSFTGPPTEVVTLRTGAKYVWPVGTTHNSMTSSGGYTLLSPMAYNSAGTAVSGRASQIVIGKWQ